MNEAKFTKGPYYYEASSGYVREAENDAAVAQVFDNDGHVNPDYVRPLPQAANGHLFAAAPKMYEALESITTLLCGSKRLMENQISYARGTAKEALAKARGEL